MYTSIVPDLNDQRYRELIARAAGLPRIPTASNVIERRWPVKLSPVHPIVSEKDRQLFYG